MEGNSDAALRARGDLSSAIGTVREMYLAQRANGASHDKARASIERQLKILEKLAGDNKKAKAQVDALRQSLNALKDKEVTVTTVFKARSNNAMSATNAEPIRRAGGGLVTGPGTSTSDSIPALLSNGEYVLPADVTRRIGVKRLDALRKAGGRTDVFARGRSDRDFERGNSRTDSFARGNSSQDNFVRGVFDAALKAALKAQEKALKTQVKTLKEGLKRLREAREDLLEDLTSTSSASVKSAAKSLTKLVQDAFEGFRSTTQIDDRLLARIKSTSDRLQKLADERARIADRLQEALQFAASVSGRAQGDASLLGIEVLDEDGRRLDPTGGELATGLRARLETLKKFSGDIKNLAAQGLSKTILRDLMEAGPAAAGGIAAAIGQGGQNVIRELTELQDQIDAEAKALGEFSADHLYDAGARAGEGFLTGLTGQLEQLKGTMETLAADLVRTVSDGIAAAQKAAEDRLEKLAPKESKGKKDTLTRGRSDQDTLTRGSSRDDAFARGKAPAAAVHIENYHAGNKSERRVAEELLLLTRAREGVTWLPAT